MVGIKALIYGYYFTEGKQDIIFLSRKKINIDFYPEPKLQAYVHKSCPAQIEDYLISAFTFFPYSKLCQLSTFFPIKKISLGMEDVINISYVHIFKRIFIE